MMHTLKMLLLTLLYSIRDAIIAEGWQDETGFYFGKHPQDKETTHDRA